MLQANKRETRWRGRTHEENRGRQTQGSHQSLFPLTENVMGSWKSVCTATPATNPGTSAISLGIQVLKEHQDTRDSYVCRFINFDKSDQAREPKMCLQLGPVWSFPLLEFVDCDIELLCD